MAKDSRNIATRNKQLRQEHLRDLLSKQKLVEKVLDNLKKIEDESKELDQLMIQRLKISNETRLKLIAKLLPDLKSTELTGEGGGELKVQLVRFSEESSDK